MATLTTTTALSHGMLHVRVLRARNLPTMDFGKRQDPYVLVQLENASPSARGTTDPAFNGGTSPDWTDAVNREIELYFERTSENEDVVLSFDVFANESGEDLIGTGKLNVSKITAEQTEAPTEFTVQLKETEKAAAKRGELTVQVWYGPAVRKAFRFAQRAAMVLQARDYIVGNVQSLLVKGAAPVSKLLQGPVDYLKKNRKLSIALLGVAGAGLAIAVTLFFMIGTPIMLLALLTFPIWIIPSLIAVFFTAPFWLPFVTLVGLFIAFVVTVVLGLSVTSQPVRRKGAKLSEKIKTSDVGKRVIYEAASK